MKITFLPIIGFVLVMVCLSGCNNNKHNADIRNVTIQLETIRFEKEFFQIDTLNLDQGLNQLKEKHPDFLNDFLLKILGLEGTDTTQWSFMIKKFIHDYKPIYDSTLLIDDAIKKVSSDLNTSFRYVKFYFPDYKLPETFITFVGPIDAFAYAETGGSGEILTSRAIGAGLQLHLGAQSSIYKTAAGMQLYPEYISQKFDVNQIPVNSIRIVIDDILPPLLRGGNLLDILVDHGKRMYLMDLFLPDVSEPKKLGYTEAQLKAVKENEGFVWNYFTENSLLYENDLLKIRSFVNDGPSTAEFGLGSPGFISLFIGKKMIEKYMDKNPETDLKKLLSLPSSEILKGSAYKPR